MGRHVIRGFFRGKSRRPVRGPRDGRRRRSVWPGQVTRTAATSCTSGRATRRRSCRSLTGRSLAQVPKEFGLGAPAGNFIIAPLHGSVLDIFFTKATRIFIFPQDESKSVRRMLASKRVLMDKAHGSGSVNLTSANPTYLNRSVRDALLPLSTMAFAVKERSHVRFAECAAVLHFTAGPVYVQWRSKISPEETPDIVCNDQRRKPAAAPKKNLGGRPCKATKRGRSEEALPVDELRVENEALRRKIQVLENKLIDVRLDLSSKETARARVQEKLMEMRGVVAIERQAFDAIAKENSALKGTSPDVLLLQRRAETAEAAVARQRQENEQMKTQHDKAMRDLHAQATATINGLVGERQQLLAVHQDLQSKIQASFFASGGATGSTGSPVHPGGLAPSPLTQVASTSQPRHGVDQATVPAAAAGGMPMPMRSGMPQTSVWPPQLQVPFGAAPAYLGSAAGWAVGQQQYAMMAQHQYALQMSEARRSLSQGGARSQSQGGAGEAAASQSASNPGQSQSQGRPSQGRPSV